MERLVIKLLSYQLNESSHQTVDVNIQIDHLKIIVSYTFSGIIGNWNQLEYSGERTHYDTPYKTCVKPLKVKISL